MRFDLEGIGYKVLGVLAVIAVLYYVAGLGFVVSQRTGREDAVAQAWLGTCAATHDKPTCASELQTLQDACLRQARIIDRGVDFDDRVFFQCMNERNTSDVDVEVPPPR